MEAPNGGSPTTRSRGSAKPLIGIRNFLEGPVRSPVVPPFMIAKPGLATFVRPSAVSDVVHLERFPQLCIHKYTFSVYNIVDHDCIFPCALLSVSLDDHQRSTCKIQCKISRVAISKPIWTFHWDLIWKASVRKTIVISRSDNIVSNSTWQTENPIWNGYNFILCPSWTCNSCAIDMNVILARGMDTCISRHDKLPMETLYGFPIAPRAIRQLIVYCWIAMDDVSNARYCVGLIENILDWSFFHIESSRNLLDCACQRHWSWVIQKVLANLARTNRSRSSKNHLEKEPGFETSWLALFRTQIPCSFFIAACVEDYKPFEGRLVNVPVMGLFHDITVSCVRGRSYYQRHREYFLKWTNPTSFNCYNGRIVTKVRNKVSPPKPTAAKYERHWRPLISRWKPAYYDTLGIQGVIATAVVDSYRKKM